MLILLLLDGKPKRRKLMWFLCNRIVIKIDSNDLNVGIETQKISRPADLFQLNNIFISPRLSNYWVSESGIGWKISFLWRNIFLVESDESIWGESPPLNCRGRKQSGSKPNFANSEQFNQLERSALNTIVPGKSQFCRIFIVSITPKSRLKTSMYQ